MQTRILLMLFFLGSFAEFSVAQKANFTRVGILGCIREKQDVPAFKNYLEAKPDLCLWIGDNVYGDTKTVGLPALQESYELLKKNKDFQKLYRTIPYMAGWDDHDFGQNDGGKNYPLKVQTRQEFLNFWNLGKVIPAERDGVYYSKIFRENGHNLQVIMLDVRYNRDSIGSGGDVLGEAQWTWLKQCLQEPADLRFLVSGFQVLLDKESGSETWENFPQARQRLFETIKSSGAKGVVFLTGDQHYGEVCRLDQALTYDAIELQFCGLNQTETPEFNSYRVSPVATSLHSSAFLDIFWKKSETDLPHILFRLINTETNTTELTYRVNFQELGYSSTKH